jgi:hypothetical protein
MADFEISWSIVLARSATSTVSPAFVVSGMWADMSQSCGLLSRRVEVDLVVVSCIPREVMAVMNILIYLDYQHGTHWPGLVSSQDLD